MASERNKMSNSKTMLSPDLVEQNKYAKDLEGSGFDFNLVIADAFIRGMRDIGYKNTGWALCELLDNSIQAEAKNIHVAFNIKNKEKDSPDQIAIIDDGHGMIPEMIRAAVLWGGTHREKEPNERKGFGRYGYGLPSASISFGRLFSVYSKTTENEWHEISIDLDAISKMNSKYVSNGKITVPKAERKDIPEWVKAHIKKYFTNFKQGTVVVIDKIDRITIGPMWEKIKTDKLISIKEFLLQHFGLIYRNFLLKVKVYVDNTIVEPIDPLFTTPGFRFYDEDEDVAYAMPGKNIEVKDKKTKEVVGVISIRFSYLPTTFLRTPDFKLKPTARTTKARNSRFAIRKENNGLIMMRNFRQIDVINHGCPHYTFQSNSRYVGVEINFPPSLDEEFSITTSKQQIVPSPRIWDILKNAGVFESISELESRYEKEAQALIANNEASAKKRASEAAMEQAEKFLKDPANEETPETVIEKEENLNKVAEEKSEASGVSVETVKQELIAEGRDRKWKVELIDHPGAPFYNLKPIGGQKVLYINKDHKFFRDIYGHNELPTKVRSAIEALLFVLGDRALQVKDISDDLRLFYQIEPKKWSDNLNIVLDVLDEYFEKNESIPSGN